MMKFSNLVANVAVTAAVTFGGSAFAVPTITNVDGTLSPFGGFDWASGAAAWTSGLGTAVTAGVGVGQFTLYYAAWAVALDDTGSGTLATPKLDTNPNGVNDAGKAYEYTTFQKLTATYQGTVAGLTLYSVNAGGTFDIYYDTSSTAKANTAVWTGLTDGTKIVSGTYAATGVNVINPNQANALSLNGTVTYTNATYINPALSGTSIASTLQLFGGTTTNFTAPTTSVEGIAMGDVSPTGPEALFQADGNQTFTINRTPEPASLLIVGTALAGLGFASRRRNNRA